MTVKKCNKDEHTIMSCPLHGYTHHLKSGTKTAREEPIFKDGKLHQFEKHYILIALKAEIKRTEEMVERGKQSECEDAVGASEMVEGIYLRDLKIVRERVEATPEGSW